MHETLCEHTSAISLWSIFRRDFDEKKPHTNIEYHNCITAIAFHPSNPGLLVGGTFNGEVVMWDVFKEEPLLCSSRIDEYTHREVITRVMWINTSQVGDHNERISIMTVSTDGKLLVWKPEDNLKYP